MSYLEQKQFFFESHAPGISSGTFSVVNMKGDEGISRPFSFEITLISREDEIDVDAILSNPATLHLKFDKSLPVHGMISRFEQLHEVDNNIFYRAILVPRLWRLTLYDLSEVYLKLTVPEIIEQVLGEAGFEPEDFELRLKSEYRRWSYVCQYQETHLDFISRWMEREGMYYFFEQGEKKEKLIITDTLISHVDLPEDKLVHYSPPSGLEISGQKDSVQNFLVRQKPMPKKVTLQDFNFRKSPPGVSGTAEVWKDGRGEVHIYGEHVKDDKEAERYARIRAEEFLCRRKVYLGEGAAAFLRVGFFFELDRHYRDSMNRKYLLVSLHHEGSQAAILMAGVAAALSEEEKRPYYRNSFEAIPDDAQFRPERLTHKPRFYGTINAKVESESKGEYAEVDEFGRYKVKLPFDRSDRAGQKASRWIRMATPFSGPNEGMHFPLRKGAEVLLTFMDGDPDRPIIASAVPSAEGQSVVSDQNSTKNLIQTSGGNIMHFEDQKGKQRILFQSPTANCWIRIGAANDPITVIGGSPYYHPINTTWVDPGTEPSTGVTVSGTVNVATAGTYTLTYTHGANTATRDVVVYEAGDDLDDSTSGLRYRSAGNMWTEAHDRYCDYIIGLPSYGIPKPVQYLAKKFTDGTFNPTGMKLYSYGSEGQVVSPASDVNTFSNLIKHGEIEIIKGDQFSTHEGNIYDFGGHWDYNFGNSYEEKFIGQSGIVVNASDHPFDRAPGGPGVDIKTNDISSGSGAPDVGATAFTDPEIYRFDPASKAAKSLSASSTWTEKTIGGANYAYSKEVKGLEVKYKCQDETHEVGKASYEYGYNGDGKLTSKSISKAGNSEEWKFDSGTGLMLSYETKVWTGASGNIFSLSTSMGNKVAASFELTGSQALTVKASLDVSIELSLSLSAKIGIGAAFEFKMWWNPAGKIKLKNSHFEYHGLGSKLDAKEKLQLEENTLVLNSFKTHIKNEQFRLKMYNASAEQTSFKAIIGTLFNM